MPFFLSLNSFFSEAPFKLQTHTRNKKRQSEEEEEEEEGGCADFLSMIEEGRGGAPHGIIFGLVVALAVMVPFLLGDQGEAITEAISELLSPIGLLLVPVTLLLIIQFLSSDRATVLSGIFSATGEPDSIHRLSGSPVGVALFLCILLFLLYNKFSLFGGSDEDDSD